MIDADFTNICDQCSTRAIYHGHDPEPEGWCFFGYTYEEHRAAGGLLLCPSCVTATGLSTLLKTRYGQHIDDCSGDESRPRREARLS